MCKNCLLFVKLNQKELSNANFNRYLFDGISDELGFELLFGFVLGDGADEEARGRDGHVHVQFAPHELALVQELFALVSRTIFDERHKSEPARLNNSKM